MTLKATLFACSLPKIWCHCLPTVFLETMACILCHAKNVKEIYYRYEDENEAPASGEIVDVLIAATPSAPVTTTTAPSTPSRKLGGCSDQSHRHSSCHCCPEIEETRMRFSVIFSKSSPRLLKKVKNFLLGSLVQHWEAASVVRLVNTLQASFLVSLEAKSLVVLIRQLSRATSARAWD